MHAVYGARSLALGIGTAVGRLYPEHPVCCFLVSSSSGNPAVLAGIPVIELGAFAEALREADKEEVRILIGTPEDAHRDIADALERHGFRNYVCMDSRREAELMERYFAQTGAFRSVHGLAEGEEPVGLCVYMARSHRDRRLEGSYVLPEWIRQIQVGAALTDERTAGLLDSTGDNISDRNGDYCELTALYWIWKNALPSAPAPGGSGADAGGQAEYYGLCHYRRILEIDGADLRRMKGNGVDAVLPFPTLHEPDIREHHSRYIGEREWEAMLRALGELRPEYASAFPEILRQPYLYNYNLILAKKQVLEDYCGWLFPVLERTEELVDMGGGGHAGRYIGYLGESLMTLYFLYNRNRLRIYHTGRRMFV